MKISSSTMGLIILECRLSFKMACEIFRMEETELLDYLKKSNIWYELRNGIVYLFNYETATEDVKRDKKACFKANWYLSKISQISKEKNPSLKEKKHEEIIMLLRNANIKEFSLKHGEYWSKEQKEAVLKYKLKYAKSSYEIEQELDIGRFRIYNWIENLEDENFKNSLLKLEDYHCEVYYQHRNDFKR